MLMTLADSLEKGWVGVLLKQTNKQNVSYM